MHIHLLEPDIAMAQKHWEAAESSPVLQHFEGNIFHSKTDFEVIASEMGSNCDIVQKDVVRLGTHLKSLNTVLVM